jgi:hypothetical protein
MFAARFRPFGSLSSGARINIDRSLRARWFSGGV